MKKYKVDFMVTSEDDWSVKDLSESIQAVLSEAHIYASNVFAEEYKSSLSKELEIFTGESLQYLLTWSQMNLYSFSIMCYDSELDFKQGKSSSCLPLKTFLKAYEPSHYKFISFEEDESILEVIRLT